MLLFLTEVRVFCGFISICGSFPISVKNAIRILTGIALNLFRFDNSIFFLSAPKDTFSLLLEREEDTEEGRNKNIDVREKHQLVASRMHLDRGLHMPGPSFKPATPVCALTRGN